VPIFDALVRGEALNSRLRNLAKDTRNITQSYGVKCIQYLEPFRRGSRVWQRDRHADRQTLR